MSANGVWSINSHGREASAEARLQVARAEDVLLRLGFNSILETVTVYGYKIYPDRHYILLV